MDSLDFGIIDLLRQNARAGYGDIGEVIGLSASAVKRRVDRLVAEKVIRGFTIQVDPAEAVDGLGTEAYVELFCRGTVAPEELRRILSGVPEVVDAGTVTGSADAIVHMRSRDIPSLELALERVRVAPNVDHTRSAIVLSKLIHRSREG
jgi:DNA-binding Lrp family transcriptional regulator